MKNIYIFFFFGFVFLILSTVNIEESFVTTQMRDKVIYNGKEYSIYHYLLEPYFAKYPEKKPELKIQSSALDRGYIAEFEIIENELFLTDIKIQIRNELSNDLKVKLVSVYQDIFPGTKKKKAKWKTGFIELPYGKMKNSYASPPTYENYWILEVKRGNIIEARNYNNEEFNKFKSRQFNKFKKTKKYRKLIRCFKKINHKIIKGNEADFRIKNHILDYTTRFLTK